MELLLILYLKHSWQGKVLIIYITCVIIALKDNLDNNHYYDNKYNNINESKNGNHHKKSSKDINNDLELGHLPICLKVHIIFI